MEIKKNLELMEANYSDDMKKVILLFWDGESVYEVNLNKQVYVNGKWKDDPNKSDKMDKLVFDEFSVGFNELQTVVGAKHDVYCYDGYNLLYEAKIIEKFDPSMKGKSYYSTIKEIIEDTFAIKIHYEINGKTYESKMTHGTYISSLKRWGRNPIQEKKQYERFKTKFGVPVSEKDKLIGRKIMIKCKPCYNTFYGDIDLMPED